MIKTADEIALMAESGRLLAQVFTHLDQLNLIGMNTMQINDLVESYIVEDLQARPASKGQYGYAYVLNASPNRVVCHGMPSTADVLKEGDIVNFDITLEKNDFIADSSKTYTVGQVAPAAQKLVDACYRAMWKGIQAVRPGATLGDVGFAISQYARKNGYSVVRDYCGHGIGREMHEAPEVLHWGTPRTGLRLKEGMVFTIEPMLNQGGHAVQTGKDGWTVRTCDGLLSAQFEHTVAVTESGVRVLTLRPDETIPH
ncbi:type I methionyl aminopeptidase [Alcaligenes sp. SMD-FA]|uniref:type I methionyl aminopeptidase n=1 Tax=Alcaligenes sp. SMD-FA TaxID=2991054 RepID=UPI0022272F47|nr:type I methionyl aminopeptidase [Alcaligenes sp. SMD-FA]UYY87944.1 type I methionyl aminopeptidase [Alcaligenes sp. SMD-FA]